jgi:lipooligosaccharide transport system ATP-binding protein
MGIIYCFMPPTTGKIKVFGMDVTEHPGTIKSRIGVMPQDNNLDPDLSVFENMIVYARYFDIPKKKSSKKAWELFDFAELREKASVNIKDLSGGMKRRLLLARSLINNPELLILDEPNAVWDQLHHLKSKGMTLLLTTHYMEEAEKLCDRVAIMDLGRIITTDTPESLMSTHGGNLEDVYLKLTGRSLEG